jgi:glycosyltransferase involved in cell wall biosynthesis
MHSKKVLMIAFHFPPFRGSTGIQRVLRFSRYVLDYGWQPIILTANPKAYYQVGYDLLNEIPRDVLVERAFALDTARHLSIRGSYLKWMALPDRWISWWLGAVPLGLHLIHKYRPQAIWSTNPITTAHLIGLTLHRLKGIPWIADFRDPITEENYPLDPTTRKVSQWAERFIVEHCTQAVFTTPGALEMYAGRYPKIPMSRWTVIANGYDEENFVAAEQIIQKPSTPGYPLVLLHSGLLYSSARDPRAFFSALSELRRVGKISSSNLKIVLRASGDEDYYRRHLRENNIEDIVFLEPPIPYQDALVEMLRADGLLVLQSSGCNHQIPAKIYEYLRAQRPIFALTDPKGNTAGVLKAAGIDTIVPLDSKEQIAQGLLHFLDLVREDQAPMASNEEIKRHSRKSRTKELIQLLESLHA